MVAEPVRYEVADAVCTITMNTPDRLNTLDDEMLSALPLAFDRAGEDDEVAVVVFTGAGRAFSAGGDLATMGSDTDVAARQTYFSEVVHALSRSIERVDKPIIAMLNGAAVGAGLDAALMCDIRIAADTAKLAEAYITLGLVPGNGGAYLLPRLVGLPRALELLFTGRAVSGREAAEIGLVNRAVPADALIAETYALAAELAAKPRLALRSMKRLVRESLTVPYSTALELASSQVSLLWCGAEHHAAVAQVKRLRARPSTITRS